MRGAKKVITYLVDRFPDPDAESFHVKTATLLQRLVKWGEFESRLHIRVSVEHKRENGKGCVNGGISEHQKSIIDRNGDHIEQDNEDGLNYRND